MNYSPEENLIFDNLESAVQFFPERKKEIRRVEGLLIEYRLLHINRAYGLVEGSEGLFKLGYTPGELSTSINNLRLKDLERIAEIKKSLNFYQLLKELKKDI